MQGLTVERIKYANIATKQKTILAIGRLFRYSPISSRRSREDELIQVKILRMICDDPLK
jgi:hypothetical protein